MDRNKNAYFDSEERLRILDMLGPMEPCIYGFLQACDQQNRGRFSLRDWEGCFPLAGELPRNARLEGSEYSISWGVGSEKICNRKLKSSIQKLKCFHAVKCYRNVWKNQGKQMVGPYKSGRLFWRLI